jgi:hypothetical protein
MAAITANGSVLAAMTSRQQQVELVLRLVPEAGDLHAMSLRKWLREASPQGVRHRQRERCIARKRRAAA